MPDLLHHSNDSDPTARLAQLISEISEATICAGWEMGIEYEAWSWVLAKPTAPFRRLMDDVQPEDVDAMRRYSELIGGWVHWPDDGLGNSSADGPCFVPMAEWEQLYAKRRAGEGGGHA